MDVKLFGSVLIAVLMISTAHASELNIPEQIGSDVVTVGINLDGTYYTATLDDNTIHKIELNGDENTDFTINTSTEKLKEFAKNYEDMSWLEKARFYVKDLDVPMNQVFIL